MSDSRRKRNIDATLQSAVALALLVGLILLIATYSQSDDSSDAPRLDLAAQLQQAVSFEYLTLEDQRSSLEDVLSESDVAGVGEIIDVRDGYDQKLSGATPGEDELVPHVLLVIKPSNLERGKELLGGSELIFLDQNAPAYDLKADDDGLDELRTAAKSAGQIAFMLTSAPKPAPGTSRVDEFAGRSTDDRLFVPSHPAALLGLDGAAATAVPLLVSESISDSSANLNAVRELGVQVDSFSVDPAGSTATTTP